mgnify:CR=1 FL=1
MQTKNENFATELYATTLFRTVLFAHGRVTQVGRTFSAPDVPRTFAADLTRTLAAPPLQRTHEG